MTGYKATNSDMKCRDVKFELGKWYSVDGELELCKNGFHFCVHPSGVWSYYSEKDTRVFKVEAEEVLDLPVEAGASFKMVARRIRLLEEITPGLIGNDKSNTGHSNTGNDNTGYCNTGDSNTGHSNTGHSNTGRWNTGHWNTGHWNTGYSNTGYRNTGDSNTGNSNTGNWNTGDCNTGDSNTGNSNTGNSNTGYSNTGIGNVTNYSSGVCCDEEPKIISFNIQTEYSHDEFYEKFPEIMRLAELLHEKNPINFEEFKNIPGITPEKLERLHQKQLDAKIKN